MRTRSCLLMLLLFFCFQNTAISEQTMPGRLPTSNEVEAQLLGRIADTRRAHLTKQIISGLTVNHCESLGRLMVMTANGRDSGIRIDQAMKAMHEFYASHDWQSI